MIISFIVFCSEQSPLICKMPTEPFPGYRKSLAVLLYKIIYSALTYSYALVLITTLQYTFCSKHSVTGSIMYC